MTMPSMVPFTDEDARTIHRMEKAGSYAEYEPHGPAFTFKMGGVPLACVGYEYVNKGAVAWMVLSEDARNHPGVFWALREMLETTLGMVGTLWIMVRNDWDKARRFADWLGFKETGDNATVGGIPHKLYMRVNHG